VKFRLLAAALVAATATTALPAHAAPVAVHFGTSAGTWAPTGLACTVFVEAGADGTTVLQAALAAHCIVSFHTQSTSFGTYVDCIDLVCAAPVTPVDGVPVTSATGTYWAMYENGAETGYGVDGFSADQGDDLTFAYTGYAFP
jgi:hypothetical protein